MKNIFTLALLMLFSANLFAQNPAPDRSRHGQKVEHHEGSKVYFDLSSGINNPGSMLGVGADFHVDPNVSIDGGVGLLSTWGYKLYAGGKYFLNPYHKGSAFSAGLTYNTGLSDFHTKMETIYGTEEEVDLNLLSQVNIFLAWYRYWQMGKRNNRFYFTAGYSAPTSNHKFKQIGGTPVSTNSATVLKLLAPGGIMVGIGFSFGTK